MLTKTFCENMSDQDIDDIFGEFEKTKDSVEDNGDKDSSEKAEKQLDTTKPRKLLRSIQLKLDPNRVCGPRGITEIVENFKHIKLQGKGHEKSDLDIILSQMEHWAHRLFPKLQFDDCVENVAKLGNNKSVQVYMKRFRMGMLDMETEVEETVVDADVKFDNIMESRIDELNAITSQPSQLVTCISEVQQNRMAENKRRAEEKRQSRLKDTYSNDLCSNEMFTSAMLPNSNPNKSTETSEMNQNNSEMLDVDMFLENLP